MSAAIEIRFELVSRPPDVTFFPDRRQPAPDVIQERAASPARLRHVRSEAESWRRLARTADMVRSQ